MSNEELNQWIAVAQPFLGGVVDTFVKPKLQKISAFIKLYNNVDNNSNNEKYEECFKQYLARTYYKCKYLNVLVLPNQQIDIDQIYLPLKIKSTKNQRETLINGFIEDLLKTHEKILISDTAGMGKSTLSKYLTLRIIEENKGIPVLIDLRNLKETNSIIDEIYQQINPIIETFSKELILKFVEQGEFIFIFDGFDEIQQKNADLIIRDIKVFIEKAYANWFILTSRPEPTLASFGDFQLFNISPLTNDEAYKLINIYDSLSNLNIAEKLIDDIKLKHHQVSTFLNNPFLVSLLYKTYTYTKDIPSSKVTFYDEVYCALFKNHDLSKDGWRRHKESKLEIQQFRILLRQLAFDTVKLNLVSYSRQEFIEYIILAKEKCIGIIVDENNFLNDLLSAVPLFVEEGLKIKWSHKSFQDFFAAEFIAYSDTKIEKLNQIYLQEKINYFNILDLFYELDYKSFRKTIIKNLLFDILNIVHQTKKNLNHIKDIDFQERLIVTLFLTPIFCYRFKFNESTFSNIFSQKLKEVYSIMESTEVGFQAGGMHKGQSGFGIIYRHSFKRQVLGLLFNRKEEFAEKIEIKAFDLDNLKFENNFNSDIKSIGENDNDWFNEERNYVSTTKMIKQNILNGHCLINYKIAKSTHEMIIKEIESDNNLKNEV